MENFPPEICMCKKCDRPIISERMAFDRAGNIYHVECRKLIETIVDEEVNEKDEDYRHDWWLGSR